MARPRFLVAALVLIAAAARAQTASEMRLDRVVESLTGTHRHYQQFIDGIPVVGGERGETLLRAGALRLDFDRTARGVRASSPAAIGRPAADRNVSVEAAGRGRPGVGGRDTPLVYVNINGEALLARRIIVEPRRLEPHAQYLDVNTGVLLRDDPLFYTAKQGRVFDVNPVAKLNAPSLQDQNDSVSGVPDPAYSEVDIPGLAPSGPLAGPNVQIVDIEAPFTTRADAAQPLDFDRSQPQFEEVNAYFQIDRAQRYLQSLGYTGNRQLVAYSIPVDAHAANGTDNSYYIEGTPPGHGTLYYGDGGTEDAEDSDIMLHEFGHAIHDWIGPGTLTGSSSTQSRALSEGFGDYWSFSSTYALTIQSGRDPFCIGDWDARCGGDDPSRHCGYPVGADCLRRVDSTKTMADYIQSDAPGTEHQNGAIWSSALREIFMTLVQRYGTDAGKRVSDTIVLESLFGLPPSPDYRTVAQSMIAADRQLRAGSEADVICSAMTSRGILATGECGNAPRGEWTLFQSPDAAIPIPDATGSITSTITISDTRAIAKLAVHVDIAHSSRGDLVINLVAPNGTTIKLKQSSQTDRTPDVHATFGLDAPAVDSLAALAGQPANGTWQLVVSDVYAGDVGVLQGWDLLIDFAGDTPLATRPTTTASRVVIPIVGHTIGAAGTQYRSDVYLLNRGSRETIATLIFTPSGADGRSTFAAVKATIEPGQTALFRDIVNSLFARSGTGWLEIDGDAANVLAWSEVVNTTANGVWAQSVEATSSTAAIGTADSPRYVFPLVAPFMFPNNPQPPPATHTNFGAVETSGSSGIIHGAIIDSDGKSLASFDVPIAPFGHVQLLPSYVIPANGRTMAVAFTVSGGARIIPYASIVFNSTGDAIYIRAVAAATEATTLTTPIIGTVTGVGGTSWGGDIDYINVLGNDTVQTSTVQTFYPADRPDQPVTTRRYSGAPGAVPNRLGQADIRVSAGGLVFSEVYVADNSGVAQLLSGERVGPYAISEAIAAGGSADVLRVESMAAYRTNFGVSEADGVGARVRVTLFDASGRSLASTETVLGPRQMQQIPISALYGGTIENGRLHFEVLSGGRVFGYASVLNNSNNDSVFELAR